MLLFVALLLTVCFCLGFLCLAAAAAIKIDNIERYVFTPAGWLCLAFVLFGTPFLFIDFGSLESKTYTIDSRDSLRDSLDKLEKQHNVTCSLRFTGGHTYECTHLGVE